MRVLLIATLTTLLVLGFGALQANNKSQKEQPGRREEPLEETRRATDALRSPEQETMITLHLERDDPMVAPYWRRVRLRPGWMHRIVSKPDSQTPEEETLARMLARTTIRVRCVRPGRQKKSVEFMFSSSYLFIHWYDSGISLVYVGWLDPSPREGSDWLIDLDGARVEVVVRPTFDSLSLKGFNVSGAGRIYDYDTEGRGSLSGVLHQLDMGTIKLR